MSDATKNISFRSGPAPTERFWNMADIDGDTAEITMYGEVVSEQPVDWWTGEELPGQYITPEGFAEDLAQIKNKKIINIKINSTGGDAYTGLAIHNALKALPGKKNVIVEGIAASAASVIAMAGDTVKMYPGSILMIHGVAVFAYDNFQIGDLKKLIRGMDAVERAMAAIYSKKTGTDETTIRAMMDKETWMTGAEAIAKGFADELIEGAGPTMSLSASGKLLLVNGIQHSTAGLDIPERFHIPKLAAGPSNPVNNKQISEKGEKKEMTLEELKAKCPDLVAQIEREAVERDRARIQEIEEIQDTIGDADMIAKAKYTEPTNAAALALAAMKKQAALGASFLENRKKDLEPADDVKALAPKAENPEAMKAAEDEAMKAKISSLGEEYKRIFK